MKGQVGGPYSPARVYESPWDRAPLRRDMETRNWRYWSCRDLVLVALAWLPVLNRPIKQTKALASH